MIEYQQNPELTAPEFADLLERSTLAARRPAGDLERLQAMIDGADLTITARDGDLLVGIARCVTDFAYCCYLSDLAVDRSYQRRGIGRELIERIWPSLHPDAALILLSAPAAVGYYPRVGFERHEAAFVRRRPADHDR